MNATRHRPAGCPAGCAGPAAPCAPVTTALRLVARRHVDLVRVGSALCRRAA